MKKYFIATILLTLIIGLGIGYVIGSYKINPDLNRDGRVDLTDFSILLYYFDEQKVDSIK